MRFFNTAGPSVADQHYLIDPLARLDLPEVLALIDRQRYFVLHAPRQTGKTTSLLALTQYLNSGERYRALYANIEGAQVARGDVERGIAAVCSIVAGSADLYLRDGSLEGWLRTEGRTEPPEARLAKLLRRWAEGAPKPAVLLLDEVDALVGDTLISLLRQIRAGYAQRPRAFPQSVVLCGVRDVRDYRIHTGHAEIVTGGSAFNIKTESLRLGDLDVGEVEALFRQHSEDTGRVVEPGVFEELWEDTHGQPWLVNALGYEMTWRDREARDPAVPLTLDRYRAARERLIQSRATHLDQLADKLREPRIHRVVAPLLGGEPIRERLPEDDLQYAEDLGLVRRKPELTIANRLYREVLPREITAPIQDVLHQPQEWYVAPDRRLDLRKLLVAFQQFFREQSDAWLERFEYKEAGPQLLLQAFLQRVVNGGGRITREYGLGRRRTDLYLEWPLDPQRGYHGPVQRAVFELKLLHKGLAQTVAEGIEQTADYADRCGADEAHLLVFDRRVDVDWEEKIWHRRERYRECVIDVWGV